MMWKRLAIPLALLGLCAALGGLWRLAVHSSGLATRHDGQITAINGSQLMEQVEVLKSPVVLVNFWASWCAPCKVEFPHLLAIRQKLAARGFRVIFVSIDDTTDLPAAQEFLRQSGVSFPTFYKGDQSAAFIKDIFPAWQGSVPTSLLIGPGGKLLDAWEGDTTAAELEKRVNRQLLAL